MEGALEEENNSKLKHVFFYFPKNIGRMEEALEEGNNTKL
jgi:hypothetical protein